MGGACSAKELADRNNDTHRYLRDTLQVLNNSSFYSR